MVTHEAVAAALRAFDARGKAWVLDVVGDTDLDGARLFNEPRRLRFRRGDVVVDVMVHDSGAEQPLQVLVRLTPPTRFVVRATTRGRELVVEHGSARSDAGGVARLTGLPHGITSLVVERPDAGARVRTAWVRF